MLLTVRRTTGLPIAILTLIALLHATDARALLELQPFESFVCEGDVCTPDFVRTGGNGGQVNGRELKSRSTGALFQTDKDEAEAGIRFRVCAPTHATITINGSYQGLLRGTGGGINNRGLMDIELVLRDLDAGTVLQRRLIRREEERGNSPLGTVSSPVSSFFDFGDGEEEGATIEVDLEPDRVFSAGLVLQTEASGTNALSDFRNGFRHAMLNAVRIELIPDLPDSDGDGLFDEWETNGLHDCQGNLLVDLPGMGADPNHKDVFVEYDWLASHPPSKATLDLVKARFANAPVDGGQGIRLWVDTGQLTELGLEETGGVIGSCFNTIDDDGDGLIDIEDPDCLVGDNLGGGNAIPSADIPNGRDIPRISGDSDENGIADFREIKDKHFDSVRRPIFHYAIQGQNGTREADEFDTCDDGLDNDGDGLVDGEDVNDCFNRSQAGSGGNFIVLNDNPGTFMHELGHSLGLGHGGRLPDGSANDITNCKPNYLSVMNYLFSNGVPTDEDGDGVFETTYIDYSPLTIPGGRAEAPLDDLLESDLDETQPLDTTDAVHATRFTDAGGIGRTSAVNAGINWDGENGADATGVVADINGGDENGLPADCAEQAAAEADPDGQTLTGHDDWSNLVYRFLPDTPLEGGAILPEPEPEIDPAAIDRAFSATDLAISKQVDRPFWVGGQVVTYQLTVTNLGPNGAKQPVIQDMPPPGGTWVDPPENCSLQPTNALSCELPPLPVGASHELALSFRLPLFPDCGTGQTRRIFNSASVENPFGKEIETANNHVRLEHEVLCPQFEYPAKLVCGTQGDPEVLALRRGAYGTTINVHNGNGEKVHVFAKLALANPPGNLQPGQIHPIDLVTFDYDEAFSVDCDAVAARLFGGSLPAPVIDGFLVLQSARAIDVTAVYSSAAVGDDGAISSHSSLDVEDVAMRRLRPPAPRADLVARVLAFDNLCDLGACRLSTRIQVDNIGAADAGAFATRVNLEPGGQVATSLSFPTGLAAGQSKVGLVELDFPQSVLEKLEQLCAGADLPTNAVSEENEINNIGCRDLP